MIGIVLSTVLNLSRQVATVGVCAFCHDDRLKVMYVTDEHHHNIKVCPHCIAAEDGDMRYNDAGGRFEAACVMRENLEIQVQEIEQKIAQEIQDKDDPWGRLDRDHFFEKLYGNARSYH